MLLSVDRNNPQLPDSIPWSGRNQSIYRRCNVGVTPTIGWTGCLSLPRYWGTAYPLHVFGIRNRRHPIWFANLCIDCCYPQCTCLRLRRHCAIPSLLQRAMRRLPNGSMDKAKLLLAIGLGHSFSSEDLNCFPQAELYMGMLLHLSSPPWLRQSQHSTIVVVQYLLVLGQYLHDTQKSVQAWATHGLVISATLQLGLHSQDANQQFFSSGERDQKARMMYGFILDVFDGLFIDITAVRKDAEKRKKGYEEAARQNIQFQLFPRERHVI